MIRAGRRSWMWPASALTEAVRFAGVISVSFRVALAPHSYTTWNELQVGRYSICRIPLTERSKLLKPQVSWLSHALIRSTTLAGGDVSPGPQRPNTLALVLGDTTMASLKVIDLTLLESATDVSGRVLLAEQWGDQGRSHAATRAGAIVAVVGLGYVGLPTALALADSGSRVIGVDISEARRKAISEHDVDLIDADRSRLTRHSNSPGFEVTGELKRIGEADTVIVCVPTPVDDHLVPDLRALKAACASVVEHAAAGQTLIMTSTTYVGTTADLLVGPLAARGLRAGADIHVAFSPERIDPGNTTTPQELTPRVVGGVSGECARLATEALSRTAPSLHVVSSPEAAELTKLLENSFRAVNITLANEIAEVCGRLNLDVLEVIDAAATKPYGFMPFFPGPGVGGHCIPCDPHYLLWQMRAERHAMPMLEAAMNGIAMRPGKVVARAREVLADAGRPLAGARVLVVGVAYKPNVADLRESPALEILGSLIAAGATVAYHDALFPEVRIADLILQDVADPTKYEADLVIVHTVHPGADLRFLESTPLVLDATYKMRHLPHRQTV